MIYLHAESISSVPIVNAMAHSKLDITSNAGDYDFYSIFFQIKKNLYEIFKNISYSFSIIKRKDSTDYGNDFGNN